MKQDKLKHDILDILLDCPSSVAAIFKALVQHLGYTNSLNIANLIDAGRELNNADLIEIRQMTPSGEFTRPSSMDLIRDLAQYSAWLTDVASMDVSLDEVGLWYEITEEGRRKLSVGAPSASCHTRQWTLDDAADSQALVIRAKSDEAARAALREWLRLTPGIEVLTTTEETIGAEPSRDANPHNEICAYTVKLSVGYRHRLHESSSPEVS